MRQRRKKNALAALRQYARTDTRDAVERCELCSMAIPSRHRHLLEMESRQVVCACDPCALRFEYVVGGRFKLIPRDPHPLSDFKMSDVGWDSLALPINLAFFYRSTAEERIIAMYPSPAGATESQLTLEAWEGLVAANPVLAKLEPDVEALLVNRIGETQAYYLAPMDACYRLVGLIRMYWRGLSGGEQVWHEIARYFERLDQQAVPLREARYA
ncbi:MAG TPA: DUF5947 family protein [Rhodothermales bacterium]|nr:DUF5947 family protein [Rhodothermales bacterium]